MISLAVKIRTATFSGVEGVLITVEVDINRGLPAFNIVGLADTSVKESKERVRSAIINSGYDFPVSRITINLAPADIRKEGSLFDLPIAVGILAATGQITSSAKLNFLFLGELSLNGELKKVKGVLPVCIKASENNIHNSIIPFENSAECSIVKKMNIFSFYKLIEVIEFLNGAAAYPFRMNNEVTLIRDYNEDFSDVIGQESSKRAIEIAASGNHNILLYGPPGTGKTMLAKRIPTILPKLSYEEALEVTKIYSVSGDLTSYDGLISIRPFRNPHHTSTRAALAGGGKIPMPGEISLAHNGVLFLDEILEFNKSVLEILRQPLEERVIKLSRSNYSIEYPANFMLVGSLNPCPCGNYGSQFKKCVCKDYERQRYISRLSGPLLERMDIFCSVNNLSYMEIKGKGSEEGSVSIAERVERARAVQKKRFEYENIYCNSQMDTKLVSNYCKIDKNGEKLMERIYNQYKLSPRVYSKILKVSRTIADLDGREAIINSDIIEALQYRKFIDENIV